MEDKTIEVKREIIGIFRENRLTVAEIRDVLREINEALDDISVIMEKPHTDGAV